MKAIHSCWTRPFFARNAGPFVMEDFDLLTMMLSALEWRKNGGIITMLTDSAGAEYFRSRSLEMLWNGGVEVSLDTVPSEIDPFLFWAGGKLWALRSRTEPVCMIDCDLIVWRGLDEVLRGKEIAVAHREDLAEEVYPPKMRFHMKQGYGFPEKGWDEPACNTALLYIDDMDFKNYYIDRALDFMTSLEEDDSVIIPMVFAEQRLLSICAVERGKPIFSLMDRFNLRGQDLVTHLWGHKDVLRADRSARSAYCRRCVARIRRDFPEWEEELWKIPEIINHIF